MFLSPACQNRQSKPDRWKASRQRNQIDRRLGEPQYQFSFVSPVARSGAVCCLAPTTSQIASGLERCRVSAQNQSRIFHFGGDTLSARRVNERARCLVERVRLWNRVARLRE